MKNKILDNRLITEKEKVKPKVIKKKKPKTKPKPKAPHKKRKVNKKNLKPKTTNKTIIGNTYEKAEAGTIKITPLTKIDPPIMMTNTDVKKEEIIKSSLPAPTATPTAAAAAFETALTVARTPKTIKKMMPKIAKRKTVDPQLKKKGLQDILTSYNIKFKKNDSVPILRAKLEALALKRNEDEIEDVVTFDDDKIPSAFKNNDTPEISLASEKQPRRTSLIPVNTFINPNNQLETGFNFDDEVPEYFDPIHEAWKSINSEINTFTPRKFTFNQN